MLVSISVLDKATRCSSVVIKKGGENHGRVPCRADLSTEMGVSRSTDHLGALRSDSLVDVILA